MWQQPRPPLDKGLDLADVSWPRQGTTWKLTCQAHGHAPDAGIAAVFYISFHIDYSSTAALRILPGLTAC